MLEDEMSNTQISMSRCWINNYYQDLAASPAQGLD